MAHSHRPGSLHQSNKPFKTRHTTKGARKTKQAGKVARPANRSGPKAKSVVGSKLNRKNAAKIEMLKKREEDKLSRRMFTGKDAVPKVGVIIPLCPDNDPKSACDALFEKFKSESDENDVKMPEDLPQLGHRLMDLRSQFKQSIQWIEVSRDSSNYEFVMNVLDATKAADFVVFLLSAQEEVDRLGLVTLSALRAQGIPPIFCVVQSMNDAPAKKHNDIKRSLSLFIQEQTAVQLKMHVQENEQDLVTMIRNITSTKSKPMSWRDSHPYMLVDAMKLTNVVDGEGVLEVEGYARGHPFSADRLVHIPMFGDFELEKAAEISRVHSKNEVVREYTPVDDKKQARVFENPPEALDDLAADDRSDEMISTINMSQKAVKKVPKGTSSYQAEWIIESEGEHSPSDDDDESVADMETREESNSYQDAWLKGEDEEMESGSDTEEEEVELEGSAEEQDDMDEAEAQAILDEYLESKKCKDSPDEDLQFPDEVDTPMDLPARYRFRKYRGLKSFRTSPWDPYENLPMDYSRIFQFESFEKTKKKLKSFLDEERILSASSGADVVMSGAGEMDFNGPCAGKRLRLSIKQVPIEVSEYFENGKRPFVLFGLLPHEEKMSVVNMTCHRPTLPPGIFDPETDEVTPVVKSKDELIVQCGFRRFRQRVTLSQFTNTNLHKMERFMHPGRTVVATCFAPTMLNTCPVLYFLPPDIDLDPENEEKLPINPYLLATGMLDSVDPNRMVIKRKILTGIPTRIHPSSHRNAVVIRFMFFNKEDVEYFKPLELRTKLGRRGHILSSIGTHGVMKCGFDKPIKSNDTICMLLYKRVYPVWPEAGYQSLFGKDVAIHELGLYNALMQENDDQMIQ